jgi:hypothetical protein
MHFENAVSHSGSACTIFFSTLEFQSNQFSFAVNFVRPTSVVSKIQKSLVELHSELYPHKGIEDCAKRCSCHTPSTRRAYKRQNKFDIYAVGWAHELV